MEKKKENSNNYIFSARKKNIWLIWYHHKNFFLKSDLHLCVKSGSEKEIPENVFSAFRVPAISAFPLYCCNHEIRSRSGPVMYT